MKIHIRRRESTRGISLVEILIAGLLLSIGLMGLVSTWLFSYRVTTNTDDMAVAYSLGRGVLETVKYSGFRTAPEGTTNAYYTGNEAVSVSAAHFQVTTSIVSDAVKSGTAGVAGAVPTDTALRTVTITVRLVSTNAVLYSTTTYLARAGI